MEVTRNMKTQPTMDTGKKSTEKNQLESFHQFSGEEKTELKRMVEEGYSVKQIAGRLNRGESTIKRWAVRLGVREKRTNRIWTESDVEILKHGIKHGISIPSIAMTLNRTPGAVATYATEMYKNGKLVHVKEQFPEVTIQTSERPVIPSASSDLYVKWCKAMRHYAQTEL